MRGQHFNGSIDQVRRVRGKAQPTWARFTGIFSRIHWLADSLLASLRLGRLAQML